MRGAPLLSFLFSLPLTAQAEPPTVARLLQPGDLAARTEAATILAKAQQPAEKVGTDSLRSDLLIAARVLPVGSAARVRADALLARAIDAEELRLAVLDLVADLSLRPVAEAELPAGVPGYQTLDELEIRAYPAYRMVRTNMRAGSMGAFWPLFQHIKEHEIAMTTPVQIDYAADGRANSMAFLYGSIELGPLGKSGRVEVVDMPPMTVLTLGSRGYDRADRIRELTARLASWLAA